MMIFLCSISILYILLQVAVCNYWAKGLLDESIGFAFVNPCWIYHNVKVNIFGVIFITILANFLVAPYAIGYWLYKLCTIGRR